LPQPLVEIRVGTPSYPILDAYRRDRSRVAIIRGPLGSGKTYGSVQRILQTAIEQAPNAQGVRPTRWLAIRNTYGDLEQTTAKDFLALFGPLGEMRWSDPPTFRMKVALDDGTFAQMEAIFLALDREDAIRKLRGFQVTGGWLNETKELVKPVLDMLDLRHGRYPSMADGGVQPTWHGIIGDTNSWDEDHYLWRLAHEVPSGWRFFHQPGGVLKDPTTGRWVANPDAENLRNLPEGYYVRGMEGKAEDWVAVNLGNEYGFTIDGKPVHPAYIDSVHCPRDPIAFDPRLPIVLGVDYGRTPAAAICQHIPQWGRTVVVDEFVTEDMSAADFGPALRRYLEQRYPVPLSGWGDPAGDSQGQATNDTPRQVLAASGVPVQAAPTNAPILRRAAVSRPLQRLCADGKPALLVSSKAKMIRKGLAGGFCYRRLKVSGSERYTDIPDKNMYSHVCFAAGTLISTPTGRVPIENLKENDLVSTPIGPRRLTLAAPRAAEVIEALGMVVTPDHPFATDGGWVRADASEYAILLREDDPWWKQLRFLQSVRHGPFARSTNWMASGTTGNRPGTTRQPMAPTCIAPYGNGITGGFHPITTSITSTGIEGTIGYRTSIAYTAPTTSLGIARPRFESVRAERSESRSVKQRSGAGRIPIRPGLSDWPAVPECFGVGEKSAIVASSVSAVAPYSLSTPSMKAGRDTVQRTASAPRVASEEMMTRIARASGAGIASAATASRKSGRVPGHAAESLRVETVYTLSVDEAACYYANGYLVSNCEALEYAMLGLGEGQSALRPVDYDDREPFQDQADMW